MSDRDVPVITFLSDYGACGRVRRRLPCGDRRRCPAGADHRPRPRHRAPRRPLPGRSRCAPPSPTRPRACTSRSSTRASAARGARSRCASATTDGLIVGPDNGLLTLAAEQLGGVVEAVDIGDSPECLRPISATFHGRDVFAPVAAALADGVALEALGRADRRRRAGRAEPAARAPRTTATLIAHVLSTDVYGNVSLDATRRAGRGRGLRAGGALVVERRRDCRGARLGRTFADVAGGRAARLRRRARRARARGQRRLRGRRCSGSSVDAEVVLRAAMTRSARRASTAAAPARPASTRASWRSAGAPHGTLVTAAEQTDGRGRQGRRWHAPGGPRAALLARAARSAAAAAARRRRRGRRARRAAARAQVAERRAARRAQGQRHPVEGRPQERWAVLGIGVNVALDARRAAARSCATAPARSGLARPRSSRRSRGCSRSSSAGSTRRPTRCSTPGASATRCSARRSLARGGGIGAGIDDGGRLLVKLADGGVSASNT